MNARLQVELTVTRPAHPQVESPTNEQHAVPHTFGVQPSPIHPAKPLILPIGGCRDLCAHGALLAALAVGRAG